MTPEEAWHETESCSPSHLYEVLAGPCSLYVDVEWKEESKPDEAEEHARVQQVVLASQKSIADSFGVQAAPTLVTASGMTPGGKYKASWHLHFHAPGVAWRNASEVGDFVKAHLRHFDIVDTVPYVAPKQNWRCVGSAKQAEPQRLLRPIDRDTFMNCLVQTDESVAPVGGVALVRQPSLEASHGDLIGMFANTRAGAAQWIDEQRRYMSIPFLRQRCPIAGRVHSSNHQYAIVDVEAMRWRHKCHNAACAEQPTPWQPVPDFAAGKRRMLPHCCAQAPPVAVLAPAGVAPDLVLRRSRGPPARRRGPRLD